MKTLTQADLRGKFGLFEYEDLAAKILNFLGGDYGKSFRMKDLDISPELFAMFCASGWLQNAWFPKGTFKVSDDFLERAL